MSVSNTATSLYVGSGDGQDRHGRLTFGVEIEFVCPVVPQGGHDRHAYRDDRRVAREYPGRDEGNLVLSALARAPSIQIELKDVFHDGLTYDTWLLQPDDSVGLARSDPLSAHYNADGCEVSSEILVAGAEGNRAKIRAVCAAIRSERVLLNDSTSVHVHVGRGSRGFSLLTMKKLTSLLWLVEKPLMCLQHPSRSTSEYCRLITEHSGLAVMVSEAAQPGNLSELGLQQMTEHIPSDCRVAYEIAMKRIWGAHDTEELRRLIKAQGGGYTTRGSVSYEKMGAGKANTVEFRQMGGSLEPEVVTTWAELCVAIVEFARTADAPSFRFMMVDMWDLQTRSLACAIELMRKLGFGQAAQDYYMHKHDDYYIKRDWTYYEGQDRGDFVPPLPDSS